MAEMHCFVKETGVLNLLFFFKILEPVRMRGTGNVSVLEI